MLHVCSSNSLERLAGALAHRLSARASEGAGWLEPEWIVVPNGNVATYARLQVARRNGVAANLALDHWETLLERLLELRGEPRWRLLHRRAVTVLLAGMLADPGELERIGADALQRYVRPAGSRSGERDLHTYQLAARLAGMFEEYHLSRPELIEAWLAGSPTLTGPEAATELWQSALWRRLFAPGGARDELAGAARWVLPAEVAGALPPADRLPRRLHVFGFSYMPRGTLALLRRLADATDVTLYTFAPVRPPVEQGDDLHLALKMWARPGLEFMQMLAALEPEQEEQLFTADPPPATKKKKRSATDLPDGSVQLTLFAAAAPEEVAPAALLGTIQHDIERGRKPVAAAVAADRSLTVLACPSLQREVEIVAGKIWTLLREMPLRFNDIALIVADTARFEEYTSHVRAVFQDLYNIPTSVSDAKPTSQHHILEAVELLLALPDGQFRRPELLRLLTQPALLARFHRTDADDWKAWCERTAIWFGADRSDLAGLYVDKDLLSWDQGLKRLALGAFLAPGPDGEPEIFALEGQRYVPEPLHPDELPSAALLASLVRGLVAEARFARDARLPLAEWSRHYSRLVATYLAPADADADDEMLLARARRELGRLAELDLSGRPIPARIAAEIAREALSRIPGGRGHYLADGVVVSSLQPMRPIPFPVAFIVGLSEGRFPGAEGLDALDLRRAQRAQGDVTVRERDQYLFLEALVSTSRRLHLSYVSRDAQTGEESNPSSAIEELAWMLKQHYAIESVVERHPLRRWDEDPAAQRVVLSPRARREAVLRGLERPDLAGLSRRQRSQVLRRDPAAAQSWLGLIPLPAPAARAGAARLELPITALRRFLECPLQGWARAVLGLVEEDTRDVVSCEDEPLACDRLPAAILLGDVFRAQMAQGAETVSAAALDAAFARAADRAELAGTLPAGAFGQAERLRLRGILEAWRVRLAWSNLTGPIEPVRFGRADEGARVRAIEPPLVLDLIDPSGQPLPVVLFGQTQPVNEEATFSFKLVMRDHASAADHLGAWVDHVVLAAGGLGSADGLTSTVIGAPNLNKTHSFERLSRESARAYLTALVGEMLWGSHAYFMPIEAVEEFQKGGSDLADVCEELRQSAHKAVRSDHGPVPHPRSYEPPSEHEGRAMVRRRLAPFFRDLTVDEAIAEEPEE